MKQAVEAGDQVIDQPPRRQDVFLMKIEPFQIATTSWVQQQPCQKQQVNQSKPDIPKRQSTKFNVTLSQAL